MPQSYSNLNVNDLDIKHKTILRELIKNNQWITEEDNDLKEMVFSST